MSKSVYRSVLFIPLCMLIGCAEEKPVLETSLEGRPVKVIQVGTGDAVNLNRFPAVIDAGQRTSLSFAVGGVVESVSVSESDEIGKGEEIAKLDPRDFETARVSAQAAFSNAEDEYQRAVRLAEQDAIATSVLEQRRTQRDVAKAQLDTAEKALQDSVIVAPFDGVVAELPVRRRQTVSPGSEVATIIALDTLEATVNLPASIVAQVPNEEDRSAVVNLDAAPDQRIMAAFKEANLVADATSQTYAVTFSFAAPDGLLVLPGMSATVTINRSSNGASESVVVPLSAIQSDGNGQYVWIVDSEALTVSRRDITVQPGVGENVQVTGLMSGDEIVGAGGSYLSDGLKISRWGE